MLRKHEDTARSDAIALLEADTKVDHCKYIND